MLLIKQNLIYPFLSGANIAGVKLYWQNCPTKGDLQKHVGFKRFQSLYYIDGSYWTKNQPMRKQAWSKLKHEPSFAQIEFSWSSS